MHWHRVRAAAVGVAAVRSAKLGVPVHPGLLRAVHRKWRMLMVLHRLRSMPMLLAKISMTVRFRSR